MMPLNLMNLKKMHKYKLKMTLYKKMIKILIIQNKKMLITIPNKIMAIRHIF